jgi:hypothetical protein
MMHTIAACPGQCSARGRQNTAGVVRAGQKVGELVDPGWPQKQTTTRHRAPEERGTSTNRCPEFVVMKGSQSCARRKKGQRTAGCRQARPHRNPELELFARLPGIQFQTESRDRGPWLQVVAQCQDDLHPKKGAR